MIGGAVEDKWVSPLVDARRGKLRISAGRFGGQPDVLEQKYNRHPVNPVDGSTRSRQLATNCEGLFKVKVNIP